MYECKHKMLGNTMYLKAYNGRLELHRLDAVNGEQRTYDYVKTIDEHTFNEWYDIVREVKAGRRWSLLWMMNGVVVETLLRNSNYGLCVSKQKMLRATTHSVGLLVIRESIS